MAPDCSQPPAPPSRARIALIVPFRPQAEQDRSAQLRALLSHLPGFAGASAGTFIVVVVEQSDDGRKFNRGQLLNVGFVEARRHAPELASAIFHDCDLLPPPGMLQWYSRLPERGQVIHLAGAGAWKKYVMPGYDFFGGVTALHVDDFEARAPRHRTSRVRASTPKHGRPPQACNGYPNDYWGWGMEDDQLRLRARAAGACARGVLRPPAAAGSYDDIDEMSMLPLLSSADGRTKRHLYNERLLQGRGLRLDPGWARANGLRGLHHRVLESRAAQLMPPGRAGADRDDQKVTSPEVPLGAAWTSSPAIAFVHVKVELGGAPTSDPSDIYA